jgi:hypothetical protein
MSKIFLQGHILSTARDVQISNKNDSTLCAEWKDGFTSRGGLMQKLSFLHKSFKWKFSITKVGRLLSMNLKEMVLKVK